MRIACYAIAAVVGLSAGLMDVAPVALVIVSGVVGALLALAGESQRLPSRRP